MPDADPQDLVARARGGNRAAMDAFVQRYAPFVRAALHGRLGAGVHARVDTDDLFQSTMTAALADLRGAGGLSGDRMPSVLAGGRWDGTGPAHVGPPTISSRPSQRAARERSIGDARAAEAMRVHRQAHASRVCGHFRRSKMFRLLVPGWIQCRLHDPRVLSLRVTRPS